MKNIEAIMMTAKVNPTVRSYIGAMVPSYVYKERDVDEFKRFDMGESAFSFAPSVLKRLDSLDLQVYPDPGLFTVKDEVARLFKVDPEMVTVGAGSDELIEIIPRLFMGAGEKALVISPTFFRFIDAVARVGGETVLVEASERNGFAIDEAVIDQVILEARRQQVKIIWLCNPNNPTGVVLPSSLIVKVLEGTDCFVVIDEALHEFVDPSLSTSAVKLLGGRKNVIVLRTLSKAYGLAGLRFGFGIGDPGTIALFERFRLPYNSSVFSQKVALEALRDQDHLLQVVRKTVDLRQRFLADIKGIPGILVGSESATNTLLVRHSHKDIFEELRKRKVLAADFRQANGLEGKGFVRITIKEREENKQLVAVLNAICSSTSP